MSFMVLLFRQESAGLGRAICFEVVTFQLLDYWNADSNSGTSMYFEFLVWILSWFRTDWVRLIILVDELCQGMNSMDLEQCLIPPNMYHSGPLCSNEIRGNHTFMVLVLEDISLEDISQKAVLEDCCSTCNN